MLIVPPMEVGPAWRLDFAVRAVGSEKDLRKGASRDLFEIKLRFTDGLRGCPTAALLGFCPSVISSRKNCVASDGRNSALVDESEVVVILHHNE